MLCLRYDEIALSPLQEILKISQKPNERRRVFAERIIAAPSKYLNKLTESRFKQAIADQETRNQLLWDQTEMTLDQDFSKTSQTVSKT